MDKIYSKIHSKYTMSILILMSAFLVVANTFLGFVLTNQSKSSMKTLINYRMLDIANTAADMLNGDELKNLKAADKDTARYKRVHNTLSFFRDNIELNYIYCIQIVGEKSFAFSVDPTIKDPGEFGSPVVYTDALYQASLGKAAVDAEPYSDEWGKFYSAYSPVFDSEGRVAGIVAVDFSAEWYDAQIARQVHSTVGCIAVSLFLSILLMLFVTKKLRQRVQEVTEDLRQAVDEAEIANKAKSQFLSSMSHEIRTPMNAILNMNEIILRESNDKNIASYSENIRLAGYTLLKIINDILDFSKIKAGKVEIIPVDYDLSSLINDLINVTHIRAEEKGLALTLDFDENLPKILRGDEVRIKQAIANILTNAIKYTEKGSVTFSIKFRRVEDEPDSVILLVQIKDTGIGIKPEDMKKLFQEFERIEEDRNHYVEGTGLGMAITKNLLDLMGSNLKVESVYDLGTKCSFELKQKVIDWSPLGNYKTAYQKNLKSQKKYRENFSAPKAHVLVVDDNEMNLIVFKNLLKRTKMQIDAAGSGDEGLALTQINKYDVIFLDHMMPEKDGIETLRELKAQTKNLNQNTLTICLTANAISGAREKYIAEGFDDYLTKPINPDQLEEMLLKYLPSEKIEKPDEIGNREEGIGIRDKGKGIREKGIGDRDNKSLTTVHYPLTANINVEVGLQYSAGLEDVYKNILETFRRLKEEKKNALQTAFESEDWKNYTIFVHALKSTSLQIGGEKLSAAAKELEMSGKVITSEITSETEKQEAKEYIKNRHAEVMQMYDEVADDAEQVMKNL